MPKLTQRQSLAQALARRLPVNAPDASRRRFIQQAGMLLFASSITPTALHAADTKPRPRFTTNPFSVGVASGYPTPDSVVLWTRLACEPLNEGGIPESRHFLDVEVALDEHFAKVVRSANVPAYSALAHSVHIEPRGLEPDHEYFYRFRCGDWVSATGRTRTAPALGSSPRQLKLALGSCQHLEHGYFNAYRQIIADDAQLMVFVGDYIYENSWGSQMVRRHHGPDAADLAGYRNRHAQYKLDPHLQAAHAALPWIVTWDDHEVANDYAGAQTESLDPAFLLRRAAAYQAYYEHMPLPRSMLPSGADMRIYTHVDHGDLARICMLDNRQYRDPQMCQGDNKGGSGTVQLRECPELDQPQRSMLGATQEDWLDAQLQSSGAHWNLIGQQTIFANQLQGEAGADECWTDAWDGYPAARERLLSTLEHRQVRNPLILGGDVHAFYVNDIHRQADDPASAKVALEVCTTSLTADGLEQSRLDAWRSRNPHIHLSRADVRGYTLLTLNRKEARVDLRVTDDVRSLAPSYGTLRSFSAAQARDGWRS